MNVCHKHDCAYDGSCEACNLQERLTEATNDLQAARSMLIDQERTLERIETELNHARAHIERLESV